MMLVEQVTLSDGLITLKSLTLNDAYALHEMLSDVKLTESAGLPLHTHVHQTMDFILEGNEGVKSYQQYFYGIFVNRNLVGLINLFNVDYVKSDGEFGYFIGSEYQRNGYMRRAIKLLSDFVLEQTNLKAINIYIDTSNQASLRLAHRLNLKAGSESIETDQANRTIQMVKYVIDDKSQSDL